MRRPSILSTSGLVLIAAVLLPAATNVATGALPPSWRPFLWLAWPAAGLLAVPVVVNELRRQRDRQHSLAPNAPVDAALGETLWNIPPPLRTFTDRESILAEIGKIMSKRAAGPVVLTGWPGVGKTQIAVAYAAAGRAEFEVGWWLSAESRLAVITSLAQLADRLGVGDGDQEVAAHRAVRSLEGRSRWLLVFDNVTDQQDLAGLIPGDTGQVLMTSLNPGLQQLGTIVNVEPFDAPAAERFLLTRTKSTDRAAAAALAAELGGLPLALEQAAAYCTSAGITLAGYLPRYRENHDRLLRQGGGTSRLPAQTTLVLAIRRAGRRDRPAGQLLSLCSFLAPSAGIPRWLVDAKPHLLPAPLSRVAADAISLDTTVAALVRLSLIQTDGDLLRIHPVVQTVIQDQLTSGGWLRRLAGAAQRRLPGAGGDRATDWDRRRWLLLAADLLGDALPRDPGDPAGWDKWVLALPHALRVVEGAGPVADVQIGLLRHRTGTYLFHRGEYGLAMLMLVAAIAELTEALGADDPATLTARSDRARVLVAQGNLTDGGREHEEILAIRRQRLGPEHRDTLISMNNVAFVWARQGRLAEARQQHEETLAIRRRVFGPEAPDTLISMGNLALVLAVQGELKQARELHQQSFTMRRAVLGDQHPVVLESMNNLAIVVSDLGDLDHARRLYEQTLAIRQDLLGEEHPDTLMSVNNLAFVLGLQGELSQARRLHEKTLAARRRVSGPEHPHTLISMNNLALVLAAQGHTTEARALHEQTLAVRRRIHGPHHAYCLHSENNLALVLAAQGEIEQARRLAESTLKVRRRVLGSEHPNTLESMNNLAVIQAEQGELEQARHLLEQTLRTRQRVLGDAHPRTRDSVTNLSRVRASLANGDRAAHLIAEPT